MAELQLPRRGFLLGLGALVASPAIVRASSLMPIKAQKTPIELFYGRQITFAEYQERIQSPMIAKLVAQIEKDIYYGSNNNQIEGLAALCRH